MHDEHLLLSRGEDMCEICERIIVAKQHQYLAIEHCLQQGNMLDAAEK
jgi:hypothetical protein